MGLQVVPYFQTNPYHSVAWSRTTVSLKAVHRYASSLHRFAENKHRIWNETVSNSKTKVRLRVVAILLCLPCYIRFNDVIWWSRQVYQKKHSSFFLSIDSKSTFDSSQRTCQTNHHTSIHMIKSPILIKHIRGEGCELSQPMPQIRPNSCENWILNKRWMKMSYFITSHWNSKKVHWNPTKSCKIPFKATKTTPKTPRLRRPRSSVQGSCQERPPAPELEWDQWRFSNELDIRPSSKLTGWNTALFGGFTQNGGFPWLC